MTILWCGGEDIDFPNGATPMVSDVIYYYRNDFSRCGLSSPNTNWCKSTTFSQSTSFWLHFNAMLDFDPRRIAGAGKYGSENSLCIGSDTGGKVRLLKCIGSSDTVLLAEEGTSIVSGNNNVNMFDVHVENYGESSSINVFHNGDLIISFQGDSTIDGIDYFDSVYLSGYRLYSAPCWISEIIVADEDTRLLSLKTNGISGSGDTNDWTGSYTDVDEITTSDSDKIYSTTDNADFQANLTGMPSGTWSVKAFKVSARCVDGSGSTGIQLGVKSGGTVASGDTQTASGYCQTKERMMQVNPVTGNSFTPAEIDALQINLRSVTL